MTDELLVVHGLDRSVRLGLLPVRNEAESSRSTRSRFAVVPTALAPLGSHSGARENARHDDAVEYLSELRKRISERIVVGSPFATTRQPPRSAQRLPQRTRKGFHSKSWLNSSRCRLNPKDLCAKFVQRAIFGEPSF